MSQDMLEERAELKASSQRSSLRCFLHLCPTMLPLKEGTLGTATDLSLSKLQDSGLLERPTA